MEAALKAKPKPSAKYAQRKFEVLSAAARTFSRLGFQIATLDDVAQELGVTKPALYYYANSKDELLDACGKMALDALEIALDTSDQPELHGLERLCRFFHAYAEIVCQDFGRCLVLTEPRDLAPDSRSANVARRRALNLAIRQVIRDGVGDGSIARCDERMLANLLFDAFNGLSRWFSEAGPTSLSVIVDQYLAVFMDGVDARGGRG
jgi:AcrR family transcriptional regulator